MRKNLPENNKPATIRNALAMATSSLLVAPVHAVEETEPAIQWEIDSSVLYYDEQDRVRVIKPVLSARKEIGEERFLNVRAVFDTMTGTTTGFMRFASDDDEDDDGEQKAVVDLLLCYDVNFNKH